jgi:hypothetical protein
VKVGALEVDPIYVGDVGEARILVDFENIFIRGIACAIDVAAVNNYVVEAGPVAENDFVTS